MTMQVLVDTHILLWARTRPEKLTPGETAALFKAQRRIVSAATVWEIALIQNIGRIPDDPRLLHLPIGFELLPVTPAHCEAYASLPRLHKDPFDRMLIAQARADELVLLTRDQAIASYGRHGPQTLTFG